MNQGCAMSSDTGPEYDVFISYSHADIEWVSGHLIPMLRSWSLRIWWDHSDLLPGQRLAGSLRESIRSARHVLFVCTQSFINSEWCRDELETARAQDPGSLMRKAIPVVLDRTAVPDLLSDTVWCDLTSDGLTDENQWKKLCSSIRGRWSDESQGILKNLHDMRRFFGTILDSNFNTTIVIRSHKTPGWPGLDYVVSKGSALAISHVYALLAKVHKQQEISLLTSDVLEQERDSESPIVSGDCIFIGGTVAATKTMASLSPGLLEYSQTSSKHTYIIKGTQRIEFGPHDMSFFIYKSRTVPRHTVLWLFSPFAEGCARAARYFNENYWRFVREKQNREFLTLYRVTDDEPACVGGWDAPSGATAH
jgi:hypothetical protein